MKSSTTQSGSSSNGLTAGEAAADLSDKEPVAAGKRRRRSIQFILTSLVAACVLPIWIAAGFLVYRDYQNTRTQTEQRMMETARALMQVVDRELARMQEDLAMLGSSKALLNGDLAYFYGRVKQLQEAHPGSDVILSAEDGQQLINANVPFGRPLPKRSMPEASRQVFATEKPLTTSLYRGALTGRAVISVDVPVFRESQVAYVLTMSMPTDYFAAVLDRQHLPPGWNGTIVGSDDKIVARTRLPEQFVGRAVGPGILAALANRKEGSAEVLNIEGTPMFDSFSRSMNSGWTVVIGVPKAVMLAEIWRQVAWTAAVTLLLSLAGIVLALRMARRITVSIQGLVAPALTLGRGEPIAVGNYELKETAEVGESLAKASQLIEQRAAERERAEAARRETAQLKQLNAELERSEADARARAAQLAAIMDAVPAFTNIAHDAECRHVTCNRTTAEALGLPPGDDILQPSSETGQPLFRVLRDGRELRFEELPLVVAAGTRRAVRGGEFTLVMNDGNSREIFGNAVPMFDPEGKVSGAVSAYIDITERKRAEAVLRASEERFRQVVESAPVAMFIVSDGVIRYVNPAALALFGAKTAGEIVGQPIMDRIHPDHRARVVERTQAVTVEGKAVPFVEERYLSLDGTELPVEVTAIPFAFEGRDGALVFARDISDRKREEHEKQLLEQQLRQAQKMEAVGQLAGGIAHDFNNLLMVIRGYAEIMQGRIAVTDRLQRNVEEILQATDRAASLTRQMLAFSRKQILLPVLLDLNALVSETAAMIRRLIGEDIEFRVYTAESLWAIEADSDQIIQVLMNLCVNARDAMPAGGILTLTTANAMVYHDVDAGRPFVPQGEYVSLTVADTGAGISPELQERIFEPFFTTKEVGKGTGLGLATVYGIVKQSGGYIWVDSEAGRGACFTIYLPRARGGPATERSAKVEAAAQGAGTILVTEDEPALREAIAGYLRNLGYTVLEAGSGDEALEVTRRHKGRIDLLLTDLVMPKMNGGVLSQLLNSHIPGLKTICMTGYTDDALLRHGVSESNVTLLQKPFALRALASQVRQKLAETFES